MLAAVKDKPSGWPKNGPSLTAAARDGVAGPQAGTEERRADRTAELDCFSWYRFPSGRSIEIVVPIAANLDRELRAITGVGRATVTRMCRDPRVPARRGSVARPMVAAR